MENNTNNLDTELKELIKSKQFNREDLEEVLTYMRQESDDLLNMYYKRSSKSLRIEFIWELYQIIFEELADRNLATMKKDLKEILYADLFISEDYMEEMGFNWYDSIYNTVSHMLFLERTLTNLTKEMSKNCKFEECSPLYKNTFHTINNQNKFGRIIVYNEKLN